MNPEQIILEARAGSEAALGPLLELYRNYLRVLARIEIGRKLQGKLDASDLVQETFLEAHRNFPLFQGTDEPQFACWLRQILAAKVANLVRHYFGTQGRDVRLEQELAAHVDNSSRLLGNELAASISSPSLQAVRREQAVLLADALEQLPDDYREVIILRHLEGLTFPEVARRMTRTQDSVEKLWLRGSLALPGIRRTLMKSGLPEKVEPARTDELPDDPRLMQAVQEYLKQLEAGNAPNRQEFLRRYPDLMEPLAQCLDGLELVHHAAVRKKEPASGPAADGGDGLPANPLGDFQIMREIGRGGMGIVYEALQLSLGRRVALKVLPFAATFDARHLQRFHNEAHAAAALHHTNIVPVFAVGCERGVHFYAMQLIEGQSLATVIHQIKRQQPGDKSKRTESRSQHSQGKETPSKHHEGGDATGPFLAGTDSGSHAPDGALDTVSPLSLALTTHRSSQHAKFFFTVARFMVQAAEAVEHAHQFGIVHRDIKSNT